MAPGDATGYRTLSHALRQVIARPDLITELQSRETRSKAAAKLKLSEVQATDLLNIINDLEQNWEKAPSKVHVGPPDNDIQTDKAFFSETFKQLRTTYRISLGMSVSIFVVGISFLIIAAVRSFTQPESIEVTSIIGGIGIVQIVALFYRNPLADVARTVSNAQQGKITVMSYLIGVSLVNQQIGETTPTAKHLKELAQLTEATLGQLHTYVAGTGTGSKTKSDEGSGANADSRDT
ncbi:hypothetical protein SAMN05443144_11298 [Fodinibius roseus]|uniref:Uncharacterized protein n=1 Tax=Fodinibius roseus TaxID=1194090 RepID=A0A1M5E1K4_9BACT|nr:hypothetical protein [Fodinibius roseus]SHF73046.1 hypothetical protein SAMN05443144_11298 [Fodinibius roseus]